MAISFPSTITSSSRLLPLTVLRAGDGTRTRDIKLGRLALYQLSYSRVTAELRIADNRLIKNPPLLEWWGKDSNLRRRKPADLQSAPVGHLGTPPIFAENSAELTGRIELPTC